MKTRWPLLTLLCSLFVGACAFPDAPEFFVHVLTTDPPGAFVYGRVEDGEDFYEITPCVIDTSMAGGNDKVVCRITLDGHFPVERVIHTPKSDTTETVVKLRPIYGHEIYYIRDGSMWLATQDGYTIPVNRLEADYGHIIQSVSHDFSHYTYIDGCSSKLVVC